MEKINKLNEVKKCDQHIWMETTFKRYDEVGGWHYYKCKKCNKKKKEYIVEYL